VAASPSNYRLSGFFHARNDPRKPEENNILVPLFSVQQVMRLQGGRFPRVDHCANAVFSQPGRCWRMISSPEGTGRTDHCPERW
jgi:hypothetical protein